MSLTLLVGTGLLLGGLYWLYTTYRFYQRAVRTQGEVVERYFVEGARQRATVLVVRFRAAGGEEYRFKEQAGSAGLLDPTSPPEGQPVPVVYDPQNPASARLSLRRQLWFGPAILVFLGALVLLVAIAGQV